MRRRGPVAYLALLRARVACHGSTVCCQYTDLPTCNSARETHLRGRLREWRTARAEARLDREAGR